MVVTAQNDLNAVSPKVNILGLDAEALAKWVALNGDKPFRAKQLMRWMHQRGISNFDEMTDLAKTFRAYLHKHALIESPQIIADQRASDGTRKWLLEVGAGNAIETVFIPEDDRGTLCVSTQAGCTVACPFCSTGYQGFNRNLAAHEIVGQLWWAKRTLESDGSGWAQRTDSHDSRVISNVVFMGMGEPLLNYDNTLSALRIMLDDNAYGLSRRRVTVSTSGVVPMMDRLAADCPVALAVSLHAPNDELRDHLVPLNRKYPLNELLGACERYLKVAPRDFITFEYIMLDGVNDLDEHAHQLVQIAKQVPCKFNLIPFNPYPQSGLQRSSSARVKEFAQILMQKNIVTTVRKTRGDDIDAACGQLAGDIQDRTKLKQRQSSEHILRRLVESK